MRFPRVPVREIDYYPGYYVTVDGRIWSMRSGGKGHGPRRAWLTRRAHPKTGHLRVDLRDFCGQKCTVGVHVLVALAWIGPCPGPGYLVRHRNGRPADNRACNLAWGTEEDNALDREWHRRHGWRARPVTELPHVEPPSPWQPPPFDPYDLPF